MKTLRLSLCIVTVFAAAAWSRAQVTSAGPTGGASPVHPPATPTSLVLYDQTNDASGTNSTSQDFETAFDAFDSEAADDFVVPPGTTWQITGAFIPGTYGAAAGPAPAVNLTFFADSSGLPGSPVCTYPLQTPADASGSFTFTLPTPCILGPGTYWVDAQVRMDDVPLGQWFWNTRNVQSNGGAVWRNPGNGFGTGCTDWSSFATCLPANGGPDFLFSLSGTAGGVIPPAPYECGSSTAFYDNPTPVAINDLAVVTSTINVTGAGPYLWDLNLQTFIRHTFSADLDITITSPSGTVVTLTTDNGGTNDDVFNGTIWDDQADPGSQVPYSGNPNLVTDHVYTNLVTASPLVPEEALGAFVGENPNGTWTLTISDDSGGDTGTLDAWSMQVTTLPIPPQIMVSGPVSNPTPTPLADNAVTTSTLSVSGQATRICGITANTNITHTFNADLDITLMSPAGTVVTLTTDNGGSFDNAFAGTTWDDRADPGGQVPYTSDNGLVTDATYTDGVALTPLVPEEAMSAFLGENPNGTWTLTVSDDAAGDTGTLNSWGIYVVTCSCAIAQPTAVKVDEHSGSGSTGDQNGVLEIGETVQVEPEWMNPGGTGYTLYGLGNTFSGPAGPTYTFSDSYAAYGFISPSAAANCFDATGDCYAVSITGSRPAQHFDATLNEFGAPFAVPETAPTYHEDWVLHVGESFDDVPRANLFYRFIENIFHHSVTGGCGGTSYCPGNFTLRKQMAVFVLKAKEGSAYVPPPATGIFTDVPQADPFAPWIEELYNRGVVAGCGAGPAYCPDNPVLRQQMAVFLLKTLLGSAYVPPAAVGLFGDVPISNPFAPWIEDLFNRSIAAGCGGGNFCPTNSTTRGQMAPFLVKTFGLLLYGP